MENQVIKSEDAKPYAASNEDAECIQRALEILERMHRKGETLSSPSAASHYLRLTLATEPNEVFAAIFLDNRHRLISYEVLFRGTVDGASVHPRVLVQRAMATNAAAVILAHNHPSGDPAPSRADKAITGRIKEALALVDVRVIDHIVVGTEGSVSFAERGLL